MKIVAESFCDHIWVEVRRIDSEGVQFGTCTICYQRLRSRDGPANVLSSFKAWLPDHAPAPCDHTSKTPVATQLTLREKYRDAMCTECGVVLRHPDGPGSWEEVIFNGYLIEGF